MRRHSTGDWTRRRRTSCEMIVQEVTLGRPQVSFAKRQREQAKRDRQQQKAEKRAQRKTEKPSEESEFELPVEETTGGAQ